MGILEKHVFLDQCWQNLDVKVFDKIKGFTQFYSQHAACSHELFNELWIEAEGERAAHERNTETECGSGDCTVCSQTATVESDRVKKLEEGRSCVSEN